MDRRVSFYSTTSKPTEDKFDNLLEAIRKISAGAKLVDESFATIQKNIVKLKLKLNPVFDRKLRSRIGQVEQQLEKCREKYRDLVWRSCKQAAEAQATVEDFFKECVPMLLDGEIPWKAKIDELRRYQKDIARHEPSAMELARGFLDVRGELRIIMDTWLILDNEFKHQSHGRKKYMDRLTEDLTSLCKVIGEGLGPSVANGIVRLIAIICPHLKVEYEAEDSTRVEMDMAREHLMDQLAAIASVWTVLRADIQMVSERLKNQGSAQSKEFFENDRRLKNTLHLYDSLSVVLREYQVTCPLPAM